MFFILKKTEELIFLLWTFVSCVILPFSEEKLEQRPPLIDPNVYALTNLSSLLLLLLILLTSFTLEIRVSRSLCCRKLQSKFIECSGLIRWYNTKIRCFFKFLYIKSKNYSCCTRNLWIPFHLSLLLAVFSSISSSIAPSWFPVVVLHIIIKTATNVAIITFCFILLEYCCDFCLTSTQSCSGSSKSSSSLFIFL